MDGVLVVDKPAGVTSHDVVAAARRATGERRIGHTGTLDPMATGVLPLACGRATRLVRFLIGSDKTYEAVIAFGRTTDTYDATGEETSRTGATPDREAVEAGLARQRGAFLQTPPAHSAKKLGGRRAYDLARRHEAVALAPVAVEVRALELVDFRDGRATVRLTCSAGFYVRTFAHELGAATGTGAVLEGLRRTRAGEFTLDGAVTLDRLVEGGPEGAEAAALPIDRLLPALPAVVLTAEGCARVSHGRAVGPAHGGPWAQAPGPWTRLLDAEGRLLALAEPADGGSVLHPSVVLI